MDPAARARRTRPAGACTGATTRPTTGPRAACPPDVRPATHALYGYVRTADEIVDGPRRAATPAARRAALDAWEAELDRGLAAGALPHPVVGALVDAGRRHRLPLGELQRLHGARCASTASPVASRPGRSSSATWTAPPARSGRIMAPLLGVPERHHADFGRLGLAFQLTNFLRDVREDYELDRIYLPPRTASASACAEADLGRRALDRRLRALRRARGRAARAGCSRPPSRRSRRRPLARGPASGWPARVYERVLDRVEARIDVLGRRAGLRAWMLPGVGGEGAAPVTRRATLRGAERTPLRRSAPTCSCAARASPGWPWRASWPARGRRARGRPLRDRRARDVRLRGADAVAAGDGRRSARSARRSRA